MTDAVETITAALRADAEVVRVVGQNLANSSTAGYRRAVPAAVAQEIGDVPAGVAAAGPPTTIAVTDFTAGALSATGGSLDLAIEGPGFFVVATPDGEQLTRRGDFRVSADGNLVTQLGDPLLGRNGAITVAGGSVEVASDGSVSVDGSVVDRLRLVSVSAGAQLEPTGRGHYVAPAGESLLDDAASTVRQGFLEGSNVTAVNEMIRLMEAVRHFETAQRFARGYDDMLKTAITDLGRI
jgi:flagellar basal-body rod protein FlgG